MSDCKVFRTEVEEATDGGTLGPRAASHVASCAACGDELRGREALRGLVRGLGRVDAPADFEYRLRARMAGSKPRGGHGVFGGLFPVRGIAWAAVAVCVLSVTAAVYYRQPQQTKQNAPGVVESAHGPQVSTSPTATQSNTLRENKTQQPEQVGGRQTASVTPNPPVLTQRSSGVKRVSTQPRERELSTREPRVEQTRGRSLEADLRPAPVLPVQLPLLNSGNNGALRFAAQGIQLGTTAGTLRVVLRDERGTSLTMRSVSFGSQELLSREAATRRPNSEDEEGVW